jgi:hypothetical protein
MNWPTQRIIIISRCFWDYYLHVFQKDYAYELKNKHGAEVIWIDRPTRNPFVWLRERKRTIDGILVLRPWSFHNDYDDFTIFDRLVFNIQISKYCKNKESNTLWSICCLHPWLTKKKAFSIKIYWPGDYFDPIQEYEKYKDYDLVMPWVDIERIPNSYRGKIFLSSTCAGFEFTHFTNKNSLLEKITLPKRFENRVSYIGGLSFDRIDFALVDKLASELPNTLFMLGVKSDGLSETECSKQDIIKKHSNIQFLEDLNYQELAELVSYSKVGIIPYKISGQNHRICPNKFFEYSSLGKKTISTDIPAMSRFSPPAIIAKTHNQFIDLLKRELCRDTKTDEILQLKEIAQYATAKQSLIRIANILNCN